MLSLIFLSDGHFNLKPHCLASRYIHCFEPGEDRSAVWLERCVIVESVVFAIVNVQHRADSAHQEEILADAQSAGVPAGTRERLVTLWFRQIGG